MLNALDGVDLPALAPPARARGEFGSDAREPPDGLPMDAVPDAEAAAADGRFVDAARALADAIDSATADAGAAGGSGESAAWRLALLRVRRAAALRRARAFADARAELAKVD